MTLPRVPWLRGLQIHGRSPLWQSCLRLVHGICQVGMSGVWLVAAGRGVGEEGKNGGGWAIGVLTGVSGFGHKLPVGERLRPASLSWKATCIRRVKV